MIRRIVDDVGDLHLNTVTDRLRRIEDLRANIASILDHVLEGGELPPGVRPEALGEYFDSLEREMRDLTQPRDALVGDGDLRLTDSPTDYANTLLNDFEAADGAPGRGVHVEPAEAMAARFRDLPPDQQAALRRAAEHSPAELVGTLRGDEARQRAGIQRLRGQLTGVLSAEELNALDSGIGELSRARERGVLRSPGRRADAIANIADPQLRALIERDSWIVQQLANISPEQLDAMWRSYRRGGRDPSGFRAYVRREMLTYVRSVFGEFTAAFGLPEIELFLKAPDRNTRVGGTDLVGLDAEGWVWVVDDKSHRATSVSGATALVDNLAENLTSDFRQFREDLARLQREVPEFRPDPAVADAVSRVGSAGEYIRMHLESLPPDQRFSPESLRVIRGILDRHRIRLRITSAFGEVTEISADLARIGIRVTPVGAGVPLPP
jgi:hypothetical protein